MTTDNMLKYALEYASRGWHIFPVREKPGDTYKNDKGREVTPEEKTPYIKEGLLSATTDQTKIKSWWLRWPSAMIGVNAGMSGLFVVDLDVKNPGASGITSFTELKNRYGFKDAGALHSVTPSGGMHIVFSGSGKSGSNGKTGIDTRGEGGYFIAPPSQIIFGKHPGKYMAVDDWTRIPASIPTGLIDKIYPKDLQYKQTEESNRSGKRELSRDSLNYAAGIDLPVQGEKNTRLFRVLADFAGCGYSKDECRQKLFAVSQSIGFDESLFEETMDNAFSKPRQPSIPESIQSKLERKKGVKITSAERRILEDALLSCMITYNDVIPVILDILVKEDFSSKKAADIYGGIVDLYNEGKAVDMITLSSKGIPLDDVIEVSSNYNIEYTHATSYAQIIKELSAMVKFTVALNDSLTSATIGEDLQEIITSTEKKIADIALYSGVRTTTTLNGEQAAFQLAEMTRKINSGEITQLKTGFIEFDKATGGLFPWDLLFVTGKPGDGKSALALTLAKNIGIDQKLGALYFTLEMSVRETTARLICQLTGLNFKNVLNGQLNEVGWVKYNTAVEIIKDSKIFFDDSSGLTIPELRAKVRRYKEQYGISVVIVDQLEQLKGYSNLQKHLQFDALCYDLKTMGKDFDIPVVLCHQLKVRTGKDSKSRNAEPEMDDLNQAGEKPATVIWAIVHKRGEDGTVVKSRIKILKNRNGSTDFLFPVVFLRERLLFSNAVISKEDIDFSKEKDDYDDMPDWARD